MADEGEIVDASFVLIRDGGPAFPQHGWSRDPEVVKRMMCGNGGMSMRQWYKGMALEMADFIQQDWNISAEGPEDTAQLVSEWAGSLADAMLAEDEAHAKKGQSDATT